MQPQPNPLAQVARSAQVAKTVSEAAASTESETALHTCSASGSQLPRQAASAAPLVCRVAAAGVRVVATVDDRSEFRRAQEYIVTQAYDAKTFGGTAIPGVESAEFMYDANNIVGIQLEFNSIKEMLDGKTLLEAKGFKCYESMVGVRLYVALGSPSPECPPGCDSHAGIHAFDCDQNDACCPNKQHDSQCSCWGCRNDGFCDCCGMSPGPDPDWCHCPQRGPGGNGGDCAHTLNLDLELQGEFDEDEQDDIRIWDRLWTYVGTPETARLYLENTWNGESPF